MKNLLLILVLFLFMAYSIFVSNSKIEATSDKIQTQNFVQRERVEEYPNVIEVYTIVNVEYIKIDTIYIFTKYYHFNNGIEILDSTITTSNKERD